MTDLGAGKLAFNLYLRLRMEAASIKIQKNVRRCEAKKAYQHLRASVVVLQTGLRAVSARKICRFIKQTKAATIIQVHRSLYS